MKKEYLTQRHRGTEEGGKIRCQMSGIRVAVSNLNILASKYDCKQKTCSLLPITYSLIFSLFTFFFFSCSPPEQNIETVTFTSFRDIPGATQEEIAAIDALREKVSARGRPLIVSNTYNTEAFVTEGGGIGGFTPLFAEWLTELFDIPFAAEIHELNEMLAGMLTGEIDFGTNAYTEERKLTYYMTEPHTYRTLKIMRLHGSISPYEITRRRPVRYVFLQNATQFDVVSSLLPHGSFEPLFAPTYDEMYHILANGEADAMIVFNTAEASFDIYGDIIVEDFLPLSVNPLSLFAGVRELEPVISLVTKALNAGANYTLTELYKQGYQDYLKNKFLMQLTDEEKEYMRQNPDIPFATQYYAYPSSFYDARHHKWDGIVFDVLHELENITGLNFKLIHDEHTTWPEVMELLESSTAYMVPDLVVTEERADRFIWTEKKYRTDHLALLSKWDYPNIDINEIPVKRIGVARNSAFTDFFRQWFPNVPYEIEYPNSDEAIFALERGEIDLLMSSKYRLITMANFYELSNYKVNVLFDETYESTLGFHKDQQILCSILDKALPLVDTDRIVEQWMSRTYNFEAMRLREQRPWLIGAIVLSFIALVLTTAMLINNYIKRKTITALLEKTKHISDYELMKHALTIKAMKLALWDMDIPPEVVKKDEPFSQDLPFKWSKEFRQLLGYSNEQEFPDKLSSWTNSLHPDEKEQMLTIVLMHIKDFSGKTPYDIEYRLKTKSGEYRYFHAIGMTQRDSSGFPIRFAGGMEDITEKKQMSEALAEQSIRLALAEKEHEADERIRILFDTFPMGCNLWDRNFNIIECNREILNLFGIQDKEEYIRVFHSLAPMYQPCGRKTKDMGLESISEAFEKGYHRSEWVHKRYNGEEFPAETILMRVNYRGQDAVAAYMTDLSEQKAYLAEIEKTQRKLIDARNAAEAASIAKSSFLANMSHEIRTPMNSIVGFSELAHDDVNPQKTNEYLSKISENANLLLGIINDILDISKIESGKMELEHVPFDLSEIFASCRTVILPKAEEKGLALHCYTEPFTGRKLIGDPLRLRQILLNILSNAVKFTNTGTIKLSASVKNTSDKNITIYFEVKDTGIGMTPDQIARIFDPFMQADSSITRKFGGTGLGLSITKNIIEMMGGTLQAESEAGEGSKFSFEITFDTVDYVQDDTPAEVKPDNKKKLKFKGDILVCEDNSMNQLVISEYLSRAGLEAVIAENGREGVEKVEARKRAGMKPFDLIFMDIHMPEMDGIEAAGKIRELGIKTPIVALTANVMSGEIEHYESAGMPDTLSKPFKTQELRDILEKYLPNSSEE